MIYDTIGRRVMRLIIPDQLILAVLHGDVRLADCDLPDDAVATEVHYDYTRKAFGVFVESRAFDLVPYGCELPMLPPLRMTSRRINGVIQEVEA